MAVGTRDFMAIWTYDEGKTSDVALAFQDHLYLEKCGFCASPLQHLAGTDFSSVGLRARAADRYGICNDVAQYAAGGFPLC